MQDLDEFGIYTIPSASNVMNDQQFRIKNLQRCGIENDSNLCHVISVILSMHRMQLVTAIQLDDADFKSQVISKVLKALPSASSFSLELLKQVWNQHSPNYTIGQYDDVWSCVDGILRELRFVILCTL